MYLLFQSLLGPLIHCWVLFCFSCHFVWRNNKTFDAGRLLHLQIIDFPLFRQWNFQLRSSRGGLQRSPFIWLVWSLAFRHWRVWRDAGRQLLFVGILNLLIFYVFNLRQAKPLHLAKITNWLRWKPLSSKWRLLMLIWGGFAWREVHFVIVLNKHWGVLLQASLALKFKSLRGCNSSLPVAVEADAFLRRSLLQNGLNAPVVLIFIDIVHKNSLWLWLLPQYW